MDTELTSINELSAPLTFPVHAFPQPECSSGGRGGRRTLSRHAPIYLRLASQHLPVSPQRGNRRGGRAGRRTR